MIDLSESLIPIGKAPAEVEKLTGQRPHRATIERWRLNGCSGVKLETLKVGARRMTSIEALQRFFHRVTAASDGQSVSTPSPSSRHGQANDELDRAGI